MTAEKNTIAGRLWFNTKADATTETYVITLWPYRSLSLRGFRIFMAVLASLMSIIATGFFLLGAWPVIGFLTSAGRARTCAAGEREARRLGRELRRAPEAAASLPRCAAGAPGCVAAS